MNTIITFLFSTSLGHFFRNLLDPTDFPARWTCGKWTGFHGWLYIISDIMVFLAYFSIPALLYYFMRNREKVPFRGVGILFILFILFCGLTHLMDAIIFWYPAYRLNGILLMFTGIISWITVAALIKTIPVALTMKTSDELEVILKARTFQLQQKSNNLEDFAHMVSHNLRAPVANFTSLLELYNLKKEPEEKENMIRKMEGVIANLSKTVDNLAEVVNWQTGNVQTETVAIQEAFASVLSGFRTQMEEDGVRLETEMEKGLSINYPRVYVESIFTNLIDNALKYRHADRPLIIKVSAWKSSGGITFRCSDNGRGIDMERFGHKIFGLNQTFHNNENSRGIGLYLVHHHVKSLSGSISVDSEVGVGSTFTIQLMDQPLS